MSDFLNSISLHEIINLLDFIIVVRCMINSVRKQHQCTYANESNQAIATVFRYLIIVSKLSAEHAAHLAILGRF